jgi:predicted nucleic acid-binding protein
MEVFFDTSVIVPLLIKEPGSARAVEIWKAADVSWAWEWLSVETEVALARRHAPPAAWEQWRTLSRRIRFLRLLEELSAVSEFNRLLALRAADAGHLFVCDRLVRQRSGIHLATFDTEMQAAAQRLGLGMGVAG